MTPIKKPRLADIAALAGVSVSTVSRVLNGATNISPSVREKIIKLVHEHKSTFSDYRLPLFNHVTLVSLREYVLGINQESLYFSILEAIREQCQHYNVTLGSFLFTPNVSEDYECFKDYISNHEHQAFILLGVDDSFILDRLRESTKPSILVNSEDFCMSLDSISPSNQGAGYLATHYLLERGHRQILHLSCIKRSTLMHRRDGFRNALLSFDLPFHQSDIIPLSHHTFDEGKKAVESLFLSGRLKEITALMCGNDHIALGAMETLKAKGISVPDDISLIGFDNIPMSAAISPGLTTVDIPCKDIGIQSVEYLIRRSYTPKRPALRIELGARLIERQSVSTR